MIWIGSCFVTFWPSTCSTGILPKKFSVPYTNWNKDKLNWFCFLNMSSLTARSPKESVGGKLWKSPNLTLLFHFICVFSYYEILGLKHRYFNLSPTYVNISLESPLCGLCFDIKTNFLWQSMSELWPNIYVHVQRTMYFVGYTFEYSTTEFYTVVQLAKSISSITFIIFIAVTKCVRAARILLQLPQTGVHSMLCISWYCSQTCSCIWWPKADVQELVMSDAAKKPSSHSCHPLSVKWSPFGDPFHS